MKNRSVRPGWKWLAALAISAALFVPLAALGAPALAGSSGSAQYQYRVPLCHHTHSQKHPFVTITVSSASVAAHMRNHGDTIGACTTTSTSTTTGSPGNGHGNSGAHGNSGENGNSGHHGKP
jgi:hypothetical protein